MLLDAATIHATVCKIATGPDNPGLPAHERGKRGLLIGEINRHTGGDEDRYLLFGWFLSDGKTPFEPVTSSKFPSEYWYALARWAFGRSLFLKDEQTDQWCFRPEWGAEILTALNEARRVYASQVLADSYDAPDFPLDAEIYDMLAQDNTVPIHAILPLSEVVEIIDDPEYKPRRRGAAIP